MRYLLFLFLFNSLHGVTPVMHQGRVQPLELIEHNLEYSLIPGKRPKDHWHPLSLLQDPEGYKKTPYSKTQWERLKTTEHPERVLAEYYYGLQRYPSKQQLQAEYVLFSFPFPLAISFLYLLVLFRPGWILLPFSAHTALLMGRIFITERPPVSNMYETLLFVPWIAVLFCLFINENIVKQCGASIAALLLALPLLGGVERTITPLQPVLNSQFWLTIHVLMVVGSYGLFFVAGALAHLALLNSGISQVHKYLLKALYCGVLLLIGGTLLGGVWAAQSWGRFWDWDPKESWAFISAAIYLGMIHAFRHGHIGKRGLAFGAIFGLIAITFTWYGVNYILGVGLHSYGFGKGGHYWYLAYLGCEGAFLASAKNDFDYTQRTLK